MAAKIALFAIVTALLIAAAASFVTSTGDPCCRKETSTDATCATDVIDGPTMTRYVPFAKIHMPPAVVTIVYTGIQK